MATQFKHNYKEFGDEAVAKRVKQMLAFRDEVDVENAHVKFSYDNRKTGALVPSWSLIPVADCGRGCAVCKRGCYDVRNVCFQKTVQRARANNSAILRKDPGKYWREIEERVKLLTHVRAHVGGDVVDYSYFVNLVGLAARNPHCQILVFTKAYDIVNGFIDYAGGLEQMPKNLHVLFSDWKGAEFDNPYNLPVSSPVWPDGTTGPHVTDRTFMCQGDCSECATVGMGCWTAGPSDTILFEAH